LCLCLTATVSDVQEGVEEANREDEGFYIRSGIVTVLRNADIPAGTEL